MDRSKGNLGSISKEEARLKNPLTLAYIGDTVFDLFVRTHEVAAGDEHVGVLHRKVSSVVNARSQAALADALFERLNEEEKDIYRRGRNAKVGTVPKNMEVIDYHKATGIEAVMGYLFLSGQDERLEELFNGIFEILASREEE